MIIRWNQAGHPAQAPALVTTVLPCKVPQVSFLRRYEGLGYTDCYVTELDRPVSQAAYIEAFYTTGLFKIERAILKWFASRPSTDPEARQLSLGAIPKFAAWRVEAQDREQLLLADFTGRTRSWLMAVPVSSEREHDASTRLYFGSAVVPRRSNTSDAQGMGWQLNALLGFHRTYSKLLLGAARSRLLRGSYASGEQRRGL